jgi:hypothetical protein
VGEESDYLLPWAASAGRISATEFMMLDADLVAISPASVRVVLKKCGTAVAL